MTPTNTQTVPYGSTSRFFRCYIKTTSGGYSTGLDETSVGLSISCIASNSGVATTYTGGQILATSTIGTWEDPGAGNIRFAQVDSTAAPGLYEIHVEDALLEPPGGASVDHVQFTIGGVTGMETTPLKIVFDFKVQDTFSLFNGLATNSDMQTALANITAINNVVSTTGVKVHASAKTGYVLASVQNFSNTGNWTGNLSGSVGSVAGNVGGTVAGVAPGGINNDTLAAETLSPSKFTEEWITANSFDIAAKSMLIGLMNSGSMNWDFVAHPPLSNTYGSLFLTIKGIFDEIETGITLKQALRAILAVCAGRVSGAGTNNVLFKNPAGAADRVAAIVDAQGNRSNVTLTL